MCSKVIYEGVQTDLPENHWPLCSPFSNLPATVQEQIEGFTLYALSSGITAFGS